MPSIASIGWPTRMTASGLVGARGPGPSRAVRTISWSPSHTPNTTDWRSSSESADWTRATISSALGSSSAIAVVVDALLPVVDVDASRPVVDVDASLPVVAVDVDVAVDDVAACSVPVTAGVVDVVTA